MSRGEGRRLVQKKIAAGIEGDWHVRRSLLENI
jgi:hypothetical protein